MSTKPAVNIYQNKGPRSALNLNKELEKQIGFLISSCKNFDNGAVDEAVRLAQALRILLHHNPARGTYSILEQLNASDKMSFADSGIYAKKLVSVRNDALTITNPGFSTGYQTSEVGLVIKGIQANGAPAWMAPLVEARHSPGTIDFAANEQPKKFRVWWETPFIETSSGVSFSRQSLVLVTANQDGGSHVDREVNKDYTDFQIDSMGIGYTYADIDDLTAPIKQLDRDVASASLRQIAFEVLLTLDRFFGYDFLVKSQVRANPPHPIFDHSIMVMVK